MSTTLTIDDDVAVQLDRLRRTRHVALRDAVNEALRRGLREMTANREVARTKYRTSVVEMGRCLVGGIDNVCETLTMAEGDDFR